MSSSAAPTDSVQSAAHGPAAVSSNKKKGNKKKKANSGNNKGSNGSTGINANTSANVASGTQKPTAPNTDSTDTRKDGAESAAVEEVSEELGALDLSTSHPPPQQHTAPDKPGEGPWGPDTEAGAEDDPAPAVNGHAGANGHAPIETVSGATSAKLEAMSQDREALRVEVEQLRKQLESIQEAHAQEITQLRADLDESEAAKEHAEAQYETLLGRVEKIKETLGDRLKRDKAELEEAKDRVEELEAQNDELQRTVTAHEEEANRLRSEVQEQGRELASLRSRTNLSQQNWLKEKDEITRQMQHLKAELESTTAAMGDWEVIAMDERSLRESLTEKTADLEEQLASAREAYDKVVSERDVQSQAIDGLQRALREIQEARKRELREMVESSEQQVQALKKRAQEADARAAEAEAAKEALSKELERTAPFEKEVKEKNLLIGKLRHEAIVLNDHLTKALKYIKKTKPEETIDKQLVTNHFLQFLSLDRSDPKKFQILQVMAGLLSWTDEQREKAGLARPGTAGSLRLPTSPFHRTPSSPALNSEFFSEPTPMSGKESLADLWASFLEQSVDEAAGAGAGPSRKGSMSSVTTAATRPDTRGH
ncbi:hypothetical protein MFIFM68171_03177 [Madurella fahalii]|uniref:GRIP domain-containing protein n=1 Tax=Madurella fahalii TaxID=1157608 RepID=A0ABQ0G5C9_9PEZI